MTNRVSKTAVKAFERLLSIRTEGLAELEAADAHWDGGEWSGPAWAETYDRIAEETAELVGSRFGFYRDEVLDAYWAYCNEGAQHEWDATLALMCGESDCYAKEDRL